MRVIQQLMSTVWVMQQAGASVPLPDVDAGAARHASNLGVRRCSSCSCYPHHYHYNQGIQCIQHARGMEGEQAHAIDSGLVGEGEWETRRIVVTLAHMHATRRDLPGKGNGNVCPTSRCSLTPCCCCCCSSSSLSPSQSSLVLKACLPLSSAAAPPAPPYSHSY